MNILFIIGNGFDLNIGLKTGYRDFYKFYAEQKLSDTDLIIKLKKSIKSNVETWSDLELSLGRYISQLHTLSDFDAMYFDIKEKLSKYLGMEQEKFDYSNLDSRMLFHNFLNPEKELSQRDQNELESWGNRVGRSQTTAVHVLTFNYTKTLENIVGDKASSLEIGKKRGQQAFLKGIEHVHGYVDKRLVLGVNDVGQIENEKLKKSQEVIEAMVKPIHNQRLGHTRDEVCMKMISDANLICIFGSSIGYSDQMWWEKIGEKLGDTCRLIIFHKVDDMNEEHEILGLREEREIVKKFLSMTKLSEKERGDVEKYIYVGINTDLFNLQKDRTGTV